MPRARPNSRVKDLPDLARRITECDVHAGGLSVEAGGRTASAIHVYVFSRLLWGNASLLQRNRFRVFHRNHRRAGDGVYICGIGQSFAPETCAESQPGYGPQQCPRTPWKALVGHTLYDSSGSATLSLIVSPKLMPHIEYPMGYVFIGRA